MKAVSVAFVIVGCMAFSWLRAVQGYEYPTHGAVGALDATCLTQLNDIFNGWYLITATADSQDTRPKPWFLNPARRLGCRLTLLEALQSATEDNCPPEEQLVNCFWVAQKEWKNMISKCTLFDSQKHLPSCSDVPGEAAEGIPSCDASQTTEITNSGRRLQQGPVNNAGIATWQFSNGESTGLQYDAYAPIGSPYAQPPNMVPAGVSGVDAAALGAINEGNEGGSVGGGTVTGASGCFPAMWEPYEFDQYLNGTLVERPRPKDYGGVNAVGIVSVFVYAILLCSLGFF